MRAFASIIFSAAAALGSIFLLCPLLPIMMSRDRFEVETRPIHQMPCAFVNQQTECADFVIAPMTDPRHIRFPCPSNPRIDKHQFPNRYQNSFEILHIMESFYAILGRFVLLIDAFLALRHAKHTYSSINFSHFCCTYFL